jgi:cytochrome d oxidase, subunit II (cydB)
MDLHVLWFILIGILFTGFFFLEGFDFGVGMLLPFLSKDDSERQTIISSIGPFWDGNEVWLLTAGGAMFAAFPNWYATLFSGFYVALVLMLLGLILRAVAIEYRSKSEQPGWRKTWDWLIFVGSFLPSLLWGIAITNLIVGVPIDAHMNYTGDLLTLLHPYALLGGLAFVALFLLHGSFFLSLRMSDTLLTKVRRVARLLWIPTLIIVALFVALGLFQTTVMSKFIILPIIAALTLILAGWFAWKGQSGWAFAMTSITIVFTTTTVFAGLFPNVMPSNLNPAWNLTIYNASSSPYTLQVMTWIALTLVPIVLAYQGWTYWIFRKRLTTTVVASHS